MKPARNFYDVIIVGGGLAGLISAIQLSRNTFKVLLIEKKEFPFHKVCGEYVSNEALPFLQSLGFDPFKFGASKINKLRVSTPGGKNIRTQLDLGGFGLSRYTMDYELSLIARASGAEILTSAKVTGIEFLNNQFEVKLDSLETIYAHLVIGSYGKRDVLDKKLNRDFISHHSGYMGVKYHIRTDYPIDEVGLDNFEDGYCGIVKIESDKYNLCYLYKRSDHFKFSSLPELEETILYKNPVLKAIFKSADFTSRDPEVINEISFLQKSRVENHILMCGDSAGLITPLCGNGMAMAIQSAKLLSELINRMGVQRINLNGNRLSLEKNWESVWSSHFGNRLKWGRRIQNVFGHPVLTNLSLSTIHALPPVERWLISKTHGEPIL